MPVRGKKSIADTYVSILPETSRVASEIAKAFRETDRHAREAGQRWKREMDRELSDVRAKVHADTAQARADIDRFKAQVGREHATLDVKVDTNNVSAAAARAGGQAGQAFSGSFIAGVAAIGSAPALATALASVAGTVIQLSGAAAVLPGVIGGVATSMGTAKLATIGMADAMSALDKASDGTQASVDAANAALEKLAPNARSVVETVVGLKGSFEQLQHIAADNMFAGVDTGIQRTAAALAGPLTTGIDTVSRGLNSNLLAALDAVRSDDSQGLIGRIMGNSGDALQRISGAVEPIVHVVETLTAAGTDALPRLAAGLDTVATRFDSFITKVDGNGSLAKFIDGGIDGFSQLGNIAINLGQSLGAVANAVGGGQGILPMLQQATGAMAQFLNSAEGQQMLTGYFQQGAEMLGQLKDIAIQAGPILVQMFETAHAVTGPLLSAIGGILETINKIPGGAELVVGAFVAWKSVEGVNALTSALGGVSNLLRVTLPADAAVAGGAISAALGPVAAAVSAGLYLGSLTHSPSPVYEGGEQGVSGRGNLAKALAGQPTTTPKPATAAAPSIFGTAGEGRATGPVLLDRGAERGGSTISTPAPPPVPVTTYTPPVVTQPSSGGGSSAPAVVAAQNGLQPNAVALERAIRANFPQVKDIGGWRPPDGYNEHSSGTALDIMVGGDKALGDRINQWLLANSNTFGLQYDLWQQRQWNPDGSTSGMEDRGSPTQNHRDHIHARVKGGAAAGGPLTSPAAGVTDNPATVAGAALTGSLGTPQNPMYVILAGQGGGQGGSPAASVAGGGLTGGGGSSSGQKKMAGQNHVDALAGSLLGDIAQVFGLDGSVFSDPTQWGITKLLSGAANWATQDTSGGASGGGGGGSLLSFLPQAIGDLRLGGQQDANAPFMGGMPGYGEGNSLAAGAQFIAQQTGQHGSGAAQGANPGPGNDYSNSGNLVINQYGGNTGDALNSAQGFQVARARQAVRQ